MTGKSHNHYLRKLNHHNSKRKCGGRPTVCVTCVWAGVDSVWEQEKLEARKMLENAAESHTSGARFVSRRFSWEIQNVHFIFVFIH
jgi:hypothetical protein